MGFDGLPIFVVEHLQLIAKKEGFIDGYDVKYESGSKVGDGFSSVLLSIKLVGYRRKKPTDERLDLDELALICKVQPSTAAHQESFNSELMFQREVYMYTKLLPALAAFQEEHKVLDEVAFTCYPKCYMAFHENGNSESVIILEDLRSSGYEMWKKQKPPTFEIVCVMMEQLGRFHGLSFAVRDQNPDLFNEFQYLPKHVLNIFTAPGILTMFQASFTQAASLMKDSNDVAAMERLLNDLVQIFNDGLDMKLLGQYGVVSHGDCWINNMMFVLDKGSPKSITLLDWQLSRVTSPAIDLSYFLFSCTNKSFRDFHLDKFLQIYYSNLAGIIRATGNDPDVLFPEPELHRQLCQFGKYGVVMAPILISVNLAESSEISNIDELAESILTGTNEGGLLAVLNDTKEKEFGQRIKDVLDDSRRYGWVNFN